MVLEKTLESPLDTKPSRPNQSSLKEINSENSLEGLMLKLKLRYFGHLMQRAGSLQKAPMLGKIEGRRRRGRQMMKWFDGIIDSMDMSLCKLPEIVKDRETWYAAVHRVAKRQQLSNNNNNNSTPFVVICCYSSDRKLIQPQPLSQVPRPAWPSSTLETVAPLPYCPEGPAPSAFNHTVPSA